jgi:flavodoxin
METRFSIWTLLTSSNVLAAILIALVALLVQVPFAKAVGTDKKIVVVYFSRSGNTKALAEQIRSATGGDMVELEPVDAYPKNYQATVNRAKPELASGYCPPLKNEIRNLGTYDVILLGSPCWGGSIAPPVRTFLSEYDLSGKTLAIFMTHGGSGLGRAPADIKTLAPRAILADGLAVSGRRAHDARNEVMAWISKLGLGTDPER